MLSTLRIRRSTPVSPYVTCPPQVARKEVETPQEHFLNLPLKRVVPVTWAAEEKLEILHPCLKVNAKHPLRQSVTLHLLSSAGGVASGSGGGKASESAAPEGCIVILTKQGSPQPPHVIASRTRRRGPDANASGALPGAGCRLLNVLGLLKNQLCLALEST
jgi:hypothetical protein